MRDDIPVPKYYRLKESIRSTIEEEGLGEGQLIPSERELCEVYGVSRMTARQAVKELVNEGVLYREQGRGTFVAGQKLQHQTSRLTSFTQDMLERGMEVSSTVLEVKVEGASPELARVLQVRPGEPLIRVSRIRNADGEPMALETTCMIYEVAEGILEADLETVSLYQELANRGVRIAGAEQSYEATILDESQSEHLDVPLGSAALLLERVTFDDQGRSFEYVKSFYRGDRYRATVVLRT